jgi:hypothetical protein
VPDFARATIAEHAEDLSEYIAFLRRLEPGQEVRLPLEQGESSRSVARALNSAAASAGVRLQHRPRTDGAIRFRVLGAEKRRQAHAAAGQADGQGGEGQPAGVSDPQTVAAGEPEGGEQLNAVPKPARRGRPRKNPAV